MLHRARLLLGFGRLDLLVMLQYPLNLVIWLAFAVAFHLANVGIVWAMLQRFPVLAGWHFSDMFFLYALWSLAHGVYSATFGKLMSVSSRIREGEFDRFLIRPLGPLYQIITYPDWLSVDDLLVGVGLFILAQLQTRIQWTAGTMALLVLVVAGGALIKGAVLLVLTTFSFWAVRMDAARLLIEAVELDFIRFPLTIFPRAAQLLFTFVFPLAFIAFLPSEFFLHKAGEDTLLNPSLGAVTPLVGLVAFGAAYAVWRVGLLRYQGTGS